MYNDSMIQIDLCADNETHETFLRVRLRSNKKSLIGSTHWSYRDIQTKDISSKEQAIKQVDIIGGALAEYQAEHFGDNHDASECARTAVSCLNELWDELASTGKLHGVVKIEED